MFNYTLSEDSFGKVHKAIIYPIAKDPEVIEEMQDTLGNAQMLMYFVQINLIIYQVFLSKSLQDLWAMLNTQSITIHLMIFKCS